MNEILVQIVFGWPFIVLSLFVSVIGIIFNRPGLVLVGALIIIPFSYYLNGTPRFSGFALLLPLFKAGSAWAVKEESETWPWVLFMPTFAVIAWLILAAAIAQN